MVVSNGTQVRSVKGMGLVQDLVARKEFLDLQGHLGIGHVRYSTTGAPRPQNVQPLVVECVDGIWAIAHNGNLTNAQHSCAGVTRRRGRFSRPVPTARCWSI
jgi:amidophosphoribosyltransferase